MKTLPKQVAPTLITPKGKVEIPAYLWDKAHGCLKTVPAFLAKTIKCPQCGAWLWCSANGWGCPAALDHTKLTPGGWLVYLIGGLIRDLSEAQRSLQIQHTTKDVSLGRRCAQRASFIVAWLKRRQHWYAKQGLSLPE